MKLEAAQSGFFQGMLSVSHQESKQSAHTKEHARSQTCRAGGRARASRKERDRQATALCIMSRWDKPAAGGGGAADAAAAGEYCLLSFSA